MLQMARIKMICLSRVFLFLVFLVGFYRWMSTYVVCDNEIGCFKNNAVFFLSKSPTQVGVTYQLFTRKNSKLPQSLTTDKNVISSSNFNGGKGTKFIIHGYRSSGSASFVINMKDAILKREDANVITVDWKKGAEEIIYLQAVANTRVVGELLSLLMKTLDTVAGGNSFARMHLIGLSLGAHVAGYAGKRTLGTGRITGLDPAGPWFTNADPKVCLDPSDASFVDVIHTNGIGYGIGYSVGHVDFYVNGGLSQPGCENGSFNDLFSLQLTKINKALDCSHMRAVYFFTESINSICHFQSYPCNSCTTCGTGCAKMGYDAPEGNPRGNYFLSTNSKPPFCIA